MKGEFLISAKEARAMLKIEGATAVITGGGSGIGEAMARCWVRQGGRVVLADVVPDALERVEREIRAAGGEVATKVCNVTKEEDSAALARLAVERFGGIHLVFPAAGIIRDGLMVAVDRESGKVTKKMSLDQFRSVLDINLTGVFLTVRDCAEQMINSGSRGLICLISSTGSLGTAGQINYASSKAAMSVFPKVITAEFFRRGVADRIRCVAVAPGYVATPMVKGMDQKALAGILKEVPVGRLVEPDEIASLVSEMYRNEAVAGEVYFIHGGLRLGSRG
ncbi:MAG TPA: SDR family NAD(P)-dependent oxidoreductase [Syntrophales bacterium]|nr:SDR family NAD(P)-dependent oxidoreductase [Syntrophales bacterium]